MGNLTLLTILAVWLFVFMIVISKDEE